MTAWSYVTMYTEACPEPVIAGKNMAGQNNICCYFLVAGTSAAAPEAAGVFALALEAK